MKKSDEHKSGLTVGVLQFDIQWEQAVINLRKIEKLVHEKLDNVDLLVLPEAFTTGFSVKNFKSESLVSSASIQWMKDFSEKHNIAICGSIFVEEEGKNFNRFVWVDQEQIVTYNKRHLFAIGGEDVKFNRGQERVIINFKGWRILPQICYDLRFPVWSRNQKEYDILINVANWPAPRNKVWKTLLKARAIENQCYVVGANRVGDDAMNISYKGNSMVLDASGSYLKKAGNKEELLVVQLELDQLKSFRRKFDTLADQDQFFID